MTDHPKTYALTDEVLGRLQQFGHFWAWHLSVPSMQWQPLRGFVDPNGNYTPPGTYPIDDVLQLFGPEHGAELEKRLYRSIQDRSYVSYRCEFDQPDGSVIAYHTGAEPFLDEAGTVTGLYGLTRDISEQVRSERLAADTRSMLERAQRLGRMGHWRIDAATGDLFWSDTLYQMMGVDPLDKMTVERFLQMIPAPDRKTIEEKRNKALSALSPLTYSVDVVRPDGTPIVVQTIGEPEFSSDGGLKAYFGTTQDITRMIMAERVAGENEQRLQRIFDAMDKSGIGIGVQDNDGRIIEARPALLKLTGFPDETSVLGKRWSGLQGSGGTDIRVNLGEEIEKAVAGENRAMQNLEVDWIRPDGERVSAMIRLAPLPNGVRAMIVLDQTAEKKAQAEVIARETRTVSILNAIDAAGVGFTVEDDEGRIITVSPTLLGFLGLDNDRDLIGQRWTQVFNLPKEITDRIREENEAYAGAESRPFAYPEFGLVLPDGNEIHLHARSTPLPGIGRLLLSIDVSEKYRMDQKQAEMEAHLQRVQKMEALGQLAGGVAHEINNMLHPIRTFARAAHLAKTVEEREHRINRILDCADKASQIVRETLSFARDSGRELKPHDIVELARSAIIFSRDMRQRNIELELVLPDRSLMARVDETEFTQVMINLLQNAADSMVDRGVVTVTVAPPPQDSEPAVTITIQDNGPGMPPEVVDRVFEPFFTTKGPNKGTGLGLSVVYGIINRWQGQIDVDSTVGEGTEIVITLPLIVE